MPTGTKTITERVRDPGHGFIVGFPVETTEVNLETGTPDLTTLQAYIFRVAASQRFYYEYDQIPAQTSGDTIDFGYLGDTGIGSGDDVLRVGEDDFHAMHFGITPESPNLNVYTAVSPSSSTNKALSRRGRDEGPQPSDPRGFSTTRRVDNKYDPPADTERVSFRNDKDGEFLEFAFEATDDIAAANTTLHLVGRGYKLVPVQNEDMQDKILEAAIEDDNDDAEIPSIITQVGGLGQYELGTEEPTAWDDSFARTLSYGSGATGQTATASSNTSSGGRRR